MANPKFKYGDQIMIPAIVVGVRHDQLGDIVEGTDAPKLQYELKLAGVVTKGRTLDKFITILAAADLVDTHAEVPEP